MRQKNRSGKAAHWLIGSVACLVLLSGCVTRSLTIKTNPPGAMVYVNDQLKGTTPVTYDFVWYGWHRVMIRKEGFQRLDDRKRLRAPVYLWIPVDLVMELLPFRIRDERTWEYVLAPQTDKTPLPPDMFLNKPQVQAPAAAAMDVKVHAPSMAATENEPAPPAKKEWVK